MHRCATGRCWAGRRSTSQRCARRWLAGRTSSTCIMRQPGYFSSEFLLTFHALFLLYREDGTKFGSLVDNYPAYGPFSLSVCVWYKLSFYNTGDFREMEPLCQHLMRPLKVTFSTPETLVYSHFRDVSWGTKDGLSTTKTRLGWEKQSLRHYQVLKSTTTLINVHASSISGLSSSW